MIKAVVIDVDDTLCLTEAACFEMENETLAAMGRPPMSREVHISTWGQPLFEAITARSPGVDVEAFKAAYHPIIAEYTSSGKLDSIPEANYQALDSLLAMGKKLIVLTSRTHGELKHMLEPDHLLASRVEAFYYKDTTQYHKPDPRVFDELLANHGLEAAHCVYVGDSIGDAVAARQAGLGFIASLESGLRQRSDFDSKHVDVFITRFPDIVNAVEELDGA
ncbi:MAG TPA: HAD family hydrolase [Candidatus Limnocylindrales bacterium]|nr:HAD family hydrolase [Candidatus Limnocylindrales bacterium]